MMRNIPIGSTIRFVPNFKDPMIDKTILKRKEGTFYFGNIYPTDRPVIVGKVTENKGEVSYVYYDKFLTFRKADIVNFRDPVTASENKEVKLKQIVGELNRNTIVFESNRDAKEAYDYLLENFVDCSLRGNKLTDIKNKTWAEILLDRRTKQEEDNSKEEIDLDKMLDEANNNPTGNIII